ncbi:BMP family ABC transporter substrate-binding protein [soil metagenome]
MKRRNVLALPVAAGAIGVLNRIDALAKQADGPFKVAFVYVGPIGDLGWTWAHDQGRLALAEIPNVETTYQESVPENPADAERVIRDFAQKGNNLVITTSFGYMEPTINVAKDFPDVQFIHISGYMTAENVSTAFGKIEEPRYVSGIIAGRKTTANSIGYVAAFPIPEVIRGINAFTLGVRSVNPEATVKVVWTSTWFDPAKEREAAEALLDGGVDVITQHQDTPGPQQAAEDAGAFGIAYNADMTELAPKSELTSVIWNWGVYYKAAVEAIIAGTWTGGGQYWGSWQDGVVDLGPITDLVAPEVKTEAEAEIAKFKAGESSIFTIFTGPLVSNEGDAKIADGVAMTAEELLSIDWFVEGVDGQPSA